MDLDLKINELPISLGSQLDYEVLRSSGLKKAGLLMRLKIKPPAGVLLIWSKNCRFTFFEERIDISAVLNVRNVLNVRKMDVEYMCGTSAFLFFTQDSLARATCQVIGSRIQAIAHNHEMMGLLTDKFGVPTTQQRNIAAWEDESEQFICELNPSKTNAYFHWMQKN